MMAEQGRLELHRLGALDDGMEALCPRCLAILRLRRLRPWPGAWYDVCRACGLWSADSHLMRAVGLEAWVPAVAKSISRVECRDGSVSAGR